MNIKEFKEAYPLLRKHNIIPYLHGKQGVGKTQTVKQIAVDMGIQLTSLNLATQEVGDLIGLLTRGPDGSVYHARPEWFPTEGQGIIFLDEINRAHPEVLQAMFPFVLDGTLHRHKLPSGWHVVVAGNHNSSEFQVTDMADAAWFSRFCHIDFKPTREEFINYLENKNAFVLAGFVRDNPDALTKKANGKEHDPLEMVSPDNRILDIAIRPLDNEEINDNLRYELYCGCMGRTAASAYMTYIKKNERSISGREVIMNYGKVKKSIVDMIDPKNSRFDMLSKTMNEVLVAMQTEVKLIKEQTTYDNICDFILDLPNEMCVKFFDQLSKETYEERNKFLNDLSLCRRVEIKLNSTEKTTKKKKGTK